MFSSLFCAGQQSDPAFINFKSAGALTEFGIPFYEIDFSDWYMPLIIGGIFDLPLYQTKNYFNVSLSFFPNVVIAFLLNGQKAYEFGFNVRANLNFTISQYDVISGTVGSGPHYLIYQNGRQTDGFLFSDNFLASYIRYFELNNRHCYVKVEIGYRHISNAGIEKPNGGISNFIVGLGFNVLLKSK